MADCFVWQNVCDMRAAGVDQPLQSKSPPPLMVTAWLPARHSLRGRPARDVASNAPMHMPTAVGRSIISRSLMSVTSGSVVTARTSKYPTEQSIPQANEATQRPTAHAAPDLPLRRARRKIATVIKSSTNKPIGKATVLDWSALSLQSGNVWVDLGRADEQPLPKIAFESSASNPWFVGAVWAACHGDRVALTRPFSLQANEGPSKIRALSVGQRRAIS
ncbi:hypothetical protein Q31b_52730 [Novipirellula aureliae]|uniref:Uncharacterized protein n=1 Tax=Novipirellula aureliae TaxID=2527966 RepID=A0A5C6DGN2_9BACT|nr:hypothetical protein Q31b_52730 [Novipirellula aureliae]